MTTQEVVRGTLRPDGTLVLDQKPSLEPGPVTVVLQRVLQPSQPQEDWWQFMQRARRELEASNRPFMNDEEMTVHMDWLRQGDPVDDLLRQGQEQHRSQE